MSSLWIVVIGVVVIYAAYTLYARRIDRTVMASDPNKSTPARMYMDGADFMPTSRFVLYGYHFKSIAAAGPIVGVITAANLWGWLPSILWLMIGVSFIGWASDYSAIMMAVRNDGNSLSAIAHRAGISLAKLARLNGLDPAKPLLIGTKLRLPAAVSARPAPTAVSASNAASVRASLDRWSTHYGVDPRLARALAWMESGYQNDVVSPVGAQGVMQLLPSTWTYVEQVLIGHRVQHDADGNVRVGLAYLHHLLGAFGGNERLALSGWYQGERSVKARGPYKVSKAFVADVLALRRRM